jgi:hypothetical protein
VTSMRLGGPQKLLDVLEKGEYISFVGNQTTIPRSSREQPSHYTDFSVPAPVVHTVRKLSIS